MVLHLQGYDAAELCRRIVNHIREITVERNEHRFEGLRAGNHVVVVGIYWQVVTQQIYCVSGAS